MTIDVSSTPQVQDYQQLADALASGVGVRSFPDKQPDDAHSHARLLAIVDQCDTQTKDMYWEQFRKRSLNQEFYEGRQWASWNPRLRRIDNSPRQTDDQVVKMHLNFFQRTVDNAASRLASGRPTFTVSPGSPDQSSIDKARVAEKLLQYEWDRQEMDRVRSSLNKALLLYGDSILKVSWDPDSGETIGFEEIPDVNENGEPLYDISQGPDGAEVIIPRIKQRVPVKEGNIKTSWFHPNDFCYDPSVEDHQDGSWCMLKTRVSVDYVHRVHGVVVPGSVTGNTSYDYRGTKVDTEGNRELVTLREIWLRPGTYRYGANPSESLNFPNGYVIVCTESRVLSHGPNPFADGLFPFIHVRSSRVPGKQCGETWANGLRALQYSLNKTLSQITRANDLMGSPQWKSPKGSMKTESDLTSQPGAVIEYEYRPGFPEPTRIDGKSASPGVYNYVGMVLSEFVPMISGQRPGGLAGGAPPNVEAGVAFAELIERDMAALGETAEELRQAYELWAKFTLSRVKQYWVLPRVITVMGKYNAVEAYQFSGEDVSKNLRPLVTPDSVTPQSKAGKFNKWMTLFQSGLASPRETRFAVGTDESEELTLDQLHLNCARNENYEAKASGTVSTPIERVSIDDHEIHIEEHDRGLLDPEMQPSVNPNGWASLYIHRNYHAMLMQREMAAQMMAMGGPPEGPAPPADNQGEFAA